MLAHDETNGWIFTDEYHRWQDKHRKMGYRHGTLSWLENSGWYIGLYSIKWDNRLKPGPDAATWPDPPPHQDLDGDVI
jgi:hypothetical protein